MIRIATLLTLACVVAAAGCSNSQMADEHYREGRDVRATGNAPLDTTAGPSDHAMRGIPAAQRDQHFVKEASAGGLFEVAAGRIALSSSTDDHVKDAAQHIVNDHLKANDDLMKLAQSKSIPEANTMTADQQAMIDKLKGLSGADFDREFMAQQMQAHKNTIALFESESTGGNDSDLRTFATNCLPILRQHLQMVGGANTSSGTAIDRP